MAVLTTVSPKIYSLVCLDIFASNYVVVLCLFQDKSIIDIISDPDGMCVLKPLNVGLTCCVFEWHRYREISEILISSVFIFCTFSPFSISFSYMFSSDAGAAVSFVLLSSVHPICN